MKPKPKIWTEAERRQLARLVRTGARMSEITTKLGRHAGSVRRVAQTMKLLIKK